MSDHVYKMVELVGSSETSIEDAIQTAIKRACREMEGPQRSRSRGNAVATAVDRQIYCRDTSHARPRDHVSDVATPLSTPAALVLR